MIQATDAVKVYRHPAEPEDLSDDEEEPRWWPLAGDRQRYLRPLVTDGSKDNPDVFDVRERIPLEFAADDKAYAARRAQRIEEDLIDSFGCFKSAADEEGGDA